MAFFVNPNNSAKPRMIIYDIKKEDEVGNLELTPNESMVSEILIVNGE